MHCSRSITPSIIFMLQAQKPTSSLSLFPTLSCPEMNRTIEGKPSRPKHIKKSQEWYTYVDEKTWEVKLALNFSWSPEGDSSVRALAGYLIKIFPISRLLRYSSFSKCYSIFTEMDENQHSEAEFFYPCYGREYNSEVRPNSAYNVALFSRENPDGEEFSINIPSCADSKLHEVTECKNDGRFITSNFEDFYCKNRTVRYSYNVSSEFGSAAEVTFCEKGTKLYICKNIVQEPYTNLKLSGTLYSLSLPSSANLTIPYVIMVNGNLYPEQKNYSYLDFSGCHVRTSPVVIALSCVAIVLFIFIAIFLVWFCVCRDKCGFWIVKRFHPPLPEIHVSLPLLPNITAPAKLPGNVRAYVVFSEDHELHKNVVHCFCSFLKRDLGIDVRVHIWEENDAAASRPRYMISNLQQADRVIVVCSEGTRDSLNSDQEIGDNMYAPVIRRIVADLLIAKNPDKYMVACFEYSTIDHVPQHLQDHIHGYSRVYRLMSDLESFYFRLVGVEQRQEGGILKIDGICNYFVPDERSDCGRDLARVVDKMSIFVRKNPAWYTEENRSHAAV